MMENVWRYQASMTWDVGNEPYISDTNHNISLIALLKIKMHQSLIYGDIRNNVKWEKWMIRALCS